MADIAKEIPQSVRGVNERRLGNVVLRTYERKLRLDEIEPNSKQPRSGPKVDPRLQRQIEANEGVFEPLLVEPHPDRVGKFRIVDGERRWANSRELVAAGKEEYQLIPSQIIDRTLTDDERLRIWVHIHRQRKEWSARDKENVANQLVRHLGKAVASDILGTTVGEVDKLVDTYVLSTRFTDLPEPSAAITWARELQGISKKLMTPEVIDAVIDKVQRRQITNSKEVRQLRKILQDPIAKDHFLSREGNIRSALLCLRPTGAAKNSAGNSLVADIDALVNAMGRHSWRSIEDLKRNPILLDRIDEAQKILADLKRLVDSKE